MKNVYVAIRETNTISRHYVVIDSDIATGKCYVYNPEIGYNVVTPYKDRDAFLTAQLNKYPYDWMSEFDTSKVEIPKNWMN